MGSEILNELEGRLFVPLKDRFVQSPLGDGPIEKVIERIKESGIRPADYRSMIFENYVKHTINEFQKDNPNVLTQLTNYSNGGGDYEYSTGPLGNVIIKEGKIVVSEIDGIYIDKKTSTTILLEATTRRGAKINYWVKNKLAREIWGNYSIILKVRPQDGDVPSVQLVYERDTAKIVTPSIEDVKFPPNPVRVREKSKIYKTRKRNTVPHIDYSGYADFLRLNKPEV